MVKVFLFYWNLHNPKDDSDASGEANGDTSLCFSVTQKHTHAGIHTWHFDKNMHQSSAVIKLNL